MNGEDGRPDQDAKAADPAHTPVHTPAHTDHSKRGGELSRPVMIGDLKVREPRKVAVKTTEAEREALARRFDLTALPKLTANLEVVLDHRGTISVTGPVRVRVEQPCAITLDPVRTDLTLSLALRLVPGGDAEDCEDLELTEDDADTEDVEAYSGDVIDLGEIIAQTVAVHIPAYPRADGVSLDAMLSESGIDTGGALPDEAKPFASLAALKDKLKGGDG